MVTKVVINNNEDTPIGYLSELKAFKNGKTYEFKPGVNIIVGENGCGKQDLDFGIITADTRCWPDKSVACHIEFISNFNHNACIGEDHYFPEVIKPVSLARSEIMNADSEEEAKLMARRWYNEHVIEAMEKAIKIVKGEILVERGEED